jgi:Rieske Fe-S protein
VDNVPYIGRLTPGSERLYVATGYKKWGMTTGTVAATIIHDAIVGRENPWATLFDATRADLTHSAKDFITANADVAKHFVGDRLALLQAPSVDELAVGEGKIVQAGGTKVAAFRDEAGVVHAVSPLCGHLGCVVSWNTVERTWDCPCHGSRYDMDGRAIQGPTVKDLEPRPLGATPDS